MTHRPQRKLVYPFLLAAVLGTGCAGSGMDEGGGGAGNLDEPGTANLPAGEFVSLGLPERDSCNWGAFGQVTHVDLAAAPDGKSFTFHEYVLGTLADDTLHFGEVTCVPAAGGAFDCTSVVPPLTFDTPAGPVTETATATGTLERVSADRMQGLFELTRSCEGPGCASHSWSTQPICSSGVRIILVRAMPRSTLRQFGAYSATFSAPTLSTCPTEPAVAPGEAMLTIAIGGDGIGTLTRTDDATPFGCTVQSEDEITCSRTRERNGAIESTSINIAWTSATTFDGIVNTFQDCVALHHVQGVAR